MDLIKGNKEILESINNYKKLGIDMQVRSYRNGVLAVEVKQSRLVNAVILTKEELTNRGLEVFSTEILSKEEDFKRLSIEPTMWELNTEVVNVDWVLKSMKKYDLQRKDLVRQLGVATSNLSCYFSGERKMSKMIKTRMFYYFNTLELSVKLIKQQ